MPTTHSIKSRLQAMDNYEFEHFVAAVWERQGWSCEVSQESVDAGVDVTATKTTPYEQKKLIQAKRYGENTTVGGPDIQQYASLKHQQPNVDAVVVVTTNTFTPAAERRAADLNVKLVDGDDLVEIIEDVRAYDLVDQYAPAATRTPENERVATDGVGAIDKPDAVQSNSTVSSTESPDWLRRIEHAQDWHRLAPLGIVLGIIALAIAGVLDGAGIPALGTLASVIGSLIILPLMIIVPLMWYLDMRYVRQETDWSPNAVYYLIGSVTVPMIAVPLYYYRRYKRIGL